MEQKHILLADDDKELCGELAGILEENGYAVCCVHGGEDAIKKAKKEKFFAVLLDLKMPGLGGFAAFREIKKARPSLPVIIITAALSSEVEKKLPDAGQTPVIYKPFGITEILEKLERAQRK